MKKSELTQRIMKKVVTFEKRRTLIWFIRIILILTILIIFVTGFLVLTVKNLSETKTLELLTLFREDKEIIAEFWRDSLNTIWQESPVSYILAAILALGVILMIFILAKRKMKIAKKRLSDIAKYQKKSDNR